MGPRSNGNPYARGVSVWQRQGEQNPEAEPLHRHLGSGPRTIPSCLLPAAVSFSGHPWTSSQPKKARGSHRCEQFSSSPGERTTSHLLGEACNTQPPSSPAPNPSPREAKQPPCLTEGRGCCPTMRLLESPQSARGDRLTAMTLRVWGLWALPATPVSQFLLGRTHETPAEVAGSAQETARHSQPLAAVRIPKSLSLGREGHNSSLLLILAKVSPAL